MQSSKRTMFVRSWRKFGGLGPKKQKNYLIWVLKLLKI